MRNVDLEIIIESALMLDEGKTSAAKLAERIYESEPDLVQQVGRVWVVERLTWIIHRRRQNVEAGNQLPLPGFERLPRRIVLDDGTRPSLLLAKTPELRKYRAVLARRRDKRLAVVDRLIEFMAAYPGISVLEAMVKEKAKLEHHGEASA